LNPFITSPKRNYTGNLYCYDTSKNWLSMNKTVNLSALDNGGKTYTVTFNFNNANVNDITYNKMI